MTGFRRRDPDTAALRGGSGDAYPEVPFGARPGWIRLVVAGGCVASAMLAAGCGRQPVEILSDNSVIYGSNLGGDRLLLDGDLGSSNYRQPPHNLTVNVNSPSSNVELLFMEDDSEATWNALQLGGCNGDICAFSAPLLPPQHTEIGILHPGGAHTNPIGTELALFNQGQDQAVAIRSLYMRRHGECELGVKWQDLLPVVLAKAKDVTGSFSLYAPGIFLFPITIHYTARMKARAAMSYLRQTRLLYGDSSNGRDRGGFGLYLCVPYAECQAMAAKLPGGGFCK